jgi:hypothetical protein
LNCIPPNIGCPYMHLPISVLCAASLRGSPNSLVTTVVIILGKCPSMCTPTVVAGCCQENLAPLLSLGDYYCSYKCNEILGGGLLLSGGTHLPAATNPMISLAPIVEHWHHMLSQLIIISTIYSKKIRVQCQNGG